jgi:ElaB/YqjD/DUF883 family membrane-anchored ribosome-binding protein
MSHDLNTVKKELNNIVKDARALLDATADVAEDHVVEARARLADALKQGEGIWHRARRTALRSVQDADQTIHEHPYPSLGVALGVGVILGFLASRRL